MRKRKLLALIGVLLLTVGARAASVVVWQGTKQFQNWADVLNIDGNKFQQAHPDDVLRLSITEDGGAQLQMSYGSGWTNFEGLGSLSIKGDHEMVLTSQTISQLKQGIHIKGVNYTLTAVTLVSNDGSYATASEELFGWSSLLTSGASRGENSTVGIMAYGGAGWYWPDCVDMGDMGSIDIQLLQPASEDIIVQVLYDETGVERQQIAKGGTTCRITLSAKYNKVYSVNLMSQKAQTVSLASVNLLDRQGNPVSSGIESMTDAGRDVSTEYYNLSGARRSSLQQGINIVRIKNKGGRTTTRKIIR